MTLHFADIFTRTASAFGDDPALRHGDRRWTWTEFHEQAVRIATYLAHQGVGPGDRVGILMYNAPEYLIAQYGIFLRRAVPVNMNYRYLGDELAYLLHDSSASVVFAHEDLVARVHGVRGRTPLLRKVVSVAEDGHPVGQVPSDTTWTECLRAYDVGVVLPGSEDDTYMLYTGGTTGLPKGVVFRMTDFVRRSFTGYLYRGWDVPTDDDLMTAIDQHREQGDRRVSIPACPLMHGTGMWLGAFYAHLMGGCVVTLPGRSFDASAMWATAVAVGADAITIVGDAFAKPMLDALDQAHEAGAPFELSAMRVIQSSGVMWSAEVQTGLLRHLDVSLVDSMGSTEGAMARRIVHRGVPIETARFEPLAGTKLIAENGTVVPKDSSARGRIAASTVVPLGYFNDPEKSAATFVDIDGVRHAMAGDWAVWADDGALVLLGRGSNCINTAGEKVFPEEVEEAMKRHPAIVDCLVVGLPDDRFNERVAAVISLEPSMAGATDAEALVADVRTWLSSYKLPRTVLIVDRIERAANGKADYAWAKAVMNGG